MWLAVDAAGPGVRAWPVGADGGTGSPIAAEALEAIGWESGPLVVDGAVTAPVQACPIAVGDLAARPDGDGRRLFLPRLGEAGAGAAIGAGRLVGALEAGGWRGAPARGRLVCCCGGDGTVAWAYAREGRIERLALTSTGRALSDLLGRCPAGDAGDEDDDVAFERGLGIAEDAHNLGSDLERVLAEAANGRLRRGAVGATLAGVLIGHDAARGLRLGRLGAPVALVGAGLLADRHAIALGRFGVAVRRVDPLRALILGCQAAWRSDSDCTGNSSH